MNGGTGRVEIARSRRQLMLVACSGAIGTFASLALPMALGRAIDGNGLALAVGLIAVSIASDLFDSFATTAYAANAAARLRHALIRQILSVSPHRLLGFPTGDLVSRVSGQASEAAQADFSRISLALGVLPPVGSLIVLSIMDWRLGVAFLAGVGGVTLVLRSFSRRAEQASAGYQVAQSGIAARLTEAMTGARTIAAAGTYEAERERVLRPLEELRAQGMRMWQVLARSTAQGAVVGPLVLVVVMAAGGLLLASHDLTPGDLFAAGRYAVIGAGLGALTGVLGGLARARSATSRINAVLQVPPLSYGTLSLPDGPGRLEFDGVSVDGVLRGVTFAVPGGSSAAVVGRSGSGKSVLAFLAARLRDPDGGTVLLDGVPLPSVSEGELRRAVGCAFEKPVLLGGTVSDAIGLGREHVGATRAATAVHAHDFVVRLPHGYDTPLADAPMSGGEAQRLGLARAWDASRLLVLDDATSSLDMVTEMRIGEALLAASRTRLIITHRITTAERADLVVWLDGGTVRAVGSHAALWDEPAYRAVFQ
ncbi:ABC transporter ATP-binding protein [Allorhizocola rhizosphaerae]|uniref:ABC transporter ATP-binding protein n=1 Tax=Allorhizocola rhizosphaerae TaxID=1872709 RepID=UPI000E3E5D42|nr:ABC transporter ATP-binding protein [Allorhizocola rhizosphaerae]